MVRIMAQEQQSKKLEAALREALKLTLKGMTVAQALDKAMTLEKVVVSTRQQIQVLFADSIVSVGTGLSHGFHSAIVENMLRALHLSKSTDQKTIKHNVRINSMMESKTIEKPEKVERKKKYEEGDKFEIVADLSLQSTKETAEFPYQFSRKTGRSGVIDLPEGTVVFYLGSMVVYANKPSSKRMIFKAPAGTVAILDGEEFILNEDCLIAGVVNHIDPRDQYNSRPQEEKESSSKEAA